MTNPKIIGSAPVLFVSDVEKSAKFYRDNLGFTYERFWGTPPSFCVLWRDKFQLMLSKAENPENIVTHSLWSVYFWVDNVESLHTEFIKQNVQLGYGLTDQPHGCREFSIKDLDGYEIAFGQDMEA